MTSKDKSEETDVDALIELGISLCRRARWRDAIAPLERAVSLDPEKAVAHYQLGESYNQTDRLADALTAYETAARLEPGNWRAINAIGRVLDRLGRPEEATGAYQRAREAQRRQHFGAGLPGDGAERRGEAP
jgi:Flp pilus assembly protein TadD